MSSRRSAKTPRAARSVNRDARLRRTMVNVPGRNTFLALLGLLLALGAGCRRQAARVVEKPTAERVRLGAFMSLSGDTAQYGISALNGIRMAVDEVNASGGAR